MFAKLAKQMHEASLDRYHESLIVEAASGGTRKLTESSMEANDIHGSDISTELPGDDEIISDEILGYIDQEIDAAIESVGADSLTCTPDQLDQIVNLISSELVLPKT